MKELLITIILFSIIGWVITSDWNTHNQYCKQHPNSTYCQTN